MTESGKSERKEELATRRSGLLSKKSSALSIGALELALLKKFPREDAEEWDRIGLLVGDPAELVTRVAVALDPTVQAIRIAHENGANVLVTHHPAFIDVPIRFSPGVSVTSNPGAIVWAAIENGVALMAFHTSLDVSALAFKMLPGMLNLQPKQILIPCAHDKHKGYGQVCSVNQGDKPFNLGQLAARCTAVFGRQPRVFGDFDMPLEKVTTWTGSVTPDATRRCLAESVDCLVCGEIKYHDSLQASQAGLGVIELGHDVSELPLARLLGVSVEAAGISKECISLIDQGSNWRYPETMRV